MRSRPRPVVGSGGEGWTVLSLKIVGAVCAVASVVSVPSIGAFRHDGPAESDSKAGGRRTPLAAPCQATSRLVYAGDAVGDAACDGSRMVTVSGAGASSKDQTVGVRR